MILQLFLNLLLVAALALLIVQTLHRRVWTYILVALGAFLLWRTGQEYLLHQHLPAVFSWIHYPSLQADLNLSSYHQIEQRIVPMMAIAMVLVYLNVIYRVETARLVASAQVLLLVAAFILIAESHDFIQLMVGSAFYSVVCFYTANLQAARQKFVFYNFLAEMSLFTALSVVYSQLGTVDLTVLPRFISQGHHKDLVAVLVLLAILAKSGLFPFQNQLIDWQQLSFNRIIILSCFGTPLVGMLLYVKLYPLLQSAAFVLPGLKAVLLLTLLWSWWGAVVMDDIKAKAIYLNLMFYSFAFALLVPAADQPVVVFFILPAAVMLNLLLLMVNLATSCENYVSLMGGLWRRLKLTLALSLLGVFVFLGQLWLFYDPSQKYVFMLYVVAVVTALAHIFHNIYLGHEHAADRVSALLKNPSIVYWFPLAVGLVAAVYGQELWQVPAVWGVWLAFVVLMLAGVTRFLNPLSEHDDLQEADPLHIFFQAILVTPVKMLGRVLWLAVDFVVIERTVIGSISQMTGLMVRGLQSVQRAVWINYLVMVFIGLAIIVLTIGHYYD